jgi:CheY-like chemotaxis protein
MAVILVVEDEEQIRVLVESILVDDGHQTLSAAAPAQALAVIQADHPIDLLFTDIRLGPDVGAGLAHAGLELAQQAVELRPELRVLYTITARKPYAAARPPSGPEFRRRRIPVPGPERRRSSR